MKPILRFTAFVLLAGELFYVSCKKEYSCETCLSNPTGSTNKSPIANAGPDQTIMLPMDSVNLDGSASSDPDGVISSFQWIKISGPASFAINNVSATRTVVKNLTAGAYQFELKVTDNGGLSAKDTVRVIVNDPAQANRPPVAKAGADQTIALTTNTAVSLDGSGSTDPDNNITSYAWAKISGPSTFNIANANIVQTQVINLVQGVYQFELKVTDAGGLFSKDTMQVEVGPPPPNCNIANRPIGNANLSFFSQLPEPRYGITVATAGNKVFIAGGYTSYTTGGNPANYSSRVDIYDITTGQWTITQLSEPRIIGGFAVFGNKIFFAGGWSETGSIRYYSATVDIYDASANTWSTAQLSEARSSLAGGTIDNKVFFAGGQIDGWPNILSSTVDIYDAAANSWSTTSLSEGRYNINDLEKITVTNVGHKIFFSGGSCNTLQDCSSNRIDMYDAITNTWSNEYYMAQNGGSLFSGIAAGNKNYRVTGGYWDGGSLVEIRDEITHTTSYDCLSGTLYRPPVSNANKLIFPVSTIPMWTPGFKLTHFDVYDLTTNTWSINKLPPPGVDGPSSFITVNNEVYAVGGSSTTNGFKYDKVYKLAF